MIEPDPSHSPSCPLCGGTGKARAFPYASRWLGREFVYLACDGCGTRYINPVPDAELLAQIYAPGDYHDRFYDGDGHSAYHRTSRLLASHLPKGSRVLDYGCGAGQLLAALTAEGFVAEGGEFSAAAADNAARRAGCRVFDLSQPGWQDQGPWDCIHLGDVIEHLIAPLETLRAILGALSPDGLLSAEGPLEANPSPVNAAANLTGWVKTRLRPGEVPEFPPYHLIFTNASAQRAMFGRLGYPLTELVWQLDENGWPYRGNGAVRNAIALVAMAGAQVVPGWGNRFRSLHRKEG